jgi:uncharacterized membrane protein
MACLHKKRRGFVLIALCSTLFLLMGMIGLAFDLGRIYIARNEAQVFTDAAAMTAASKLDGTAQGVIRAREAVAKLPAKWNLGTSAFSGVRVEFSSDGQRWDSQQETDPAALRMARVIAPMNSVDITFLRITGGPDKLVVPAHSVATTGPVRITE